MEPMVLNWATRYYYTGMGLSAPANVGDNPKYEESFKTLLSDPICKLLGKDIISLSEITEFLQQYQALGVKAPFYTLPYIVKGFNGGDWKEYVSNFTQSKDICVGVVNGGKAMHVYTEGRKALGVFPYAVHVLGPKEMAAQGTDVLNDMIYGVDLSISDAYIAALKEICKISKKYEEAVLGRTVEVEHFMNGHLSSEPIPVISPAFPPYSVRKLFQYLPEVNPYDSKHMQAYMYATQASDVPPDALDYLRKIMNQVSVTEPVSKTPEMPVAEETPGVTPVTDPERLPTSGNQFAVPEEGVQFETLGDLLDYYARDGYLDRNWTIEDTIYYFSLPDDDPYRPTPVYDFNESVTSQYNKDYLIKILEHMNLINEGVDTSVMTVNHLLSELRSDKVSIGKEDVHALLRQLLRICAVKSTRDVMSIKKNETDFAAQAVRQAKAMQEYGIPDDRTIGEIVSGVENQPTQDDLAALAYKLDLPRDLTIADIMNGLDHHEEAPVQKINTIDELLKSGVLSEELAAQITAMQNYVPKKYESLSGLSVSTDITEELRQEINELMNKKSQPTEEMVIKEIDDSLKAGHLPTILAGRVKDIATLVLETYASLDTLLESTLLPTSLNVEIAQLLNSRDKAADIDKSKIAREVLESYTSLEQLVQVGILPEHLQSYAKIDSMEKLLGNNILTSEFKHTLAQELKGSGNNTDPDFTPDFNYEVAEILLKGVRKYLQKITPDMSFRDESQYRSKAVPIFYQFVSVLAARPDGVEGLNNELTKKLETVDDALKPLIQEAYDALQKFNSGSSS